MTATVAMLNDCPAIDPEIVLPALSGIAPIVWMALIGKSNSPVVTFFVLVDGALRMPLATNVKVPAISVFVSSVMTIAPDAPESRVVHPCDVLLIWALPPGTPTFTPSGYVAGPRIVFRVMAIVVVAGVENPVIV